MTKISTNTTTTNVLPMTLPVQATSSNAFEPYTTANGLRISPAPLPSHSTDVSFGAVIEGIDVRKVTDEQFQEIRKALFEHQVVCFPNQHDLPPETQYDITHRFDPESSTYGHGNSSNKQKNSILHPDLHTIPAVPQVQLIGHGLIQNHYGLPEARLKHPHHRTFHRDPISAEEEKEKQITRFYRWHIDAALYDYNPPVVTTLSAISIPQGTQTLRYDDKSGHQMPVPLGSTVFASGYKMFDLLTDEQKKIAARTRVQYFPHAYVVIHRARALPNGLSMYSEGLELPKDKLPDWQEDKIKTFPLLWKNPVTGKLALQTHGCCAEKIYIDNPDGSTTIIDDLAKVREIIYDYQRPGINPERVYCHDWKEGDFVIFHNRGLIHCITGAYDDSQTRILHQCNLAASHPPVGPTAEEIASI
ncbi:sulfonate dioxygenase [Schizosaccharomyces cryophilus OY26]|uniref:Sulfonate dioxygenase n=1 Tax=Schizosaccharomyces cryophilus (strain OY26 / ATCC MYA-4695 / CBS 11777 / NBRC 106824 / NRRL Y48691) TaxID=653667 RepID=S9VZK7_SCHCR|nr:sulfonate dioxygenase [Schizosaccharomyces cryophilus OY26]EPY51245.1 sulfonate dioxygenase [Schizosaccharomyces cryophilus OY26]